MLAFLCGQPQPKPQPQSNPQSKPQPHPKKSRNRIPQRTNDLRKKIVETESPYNQLNFEVKLKWSFHRISCKFFRNRVSLFREKEREGKYLRTILRNAME